MTSSLMRPLLKKYPTDALLSLTERDRGEHPLIDGTNVTCPGCEKSQNVLAFTPLDVSEKFQSQVVVPLRCRECKHIFALRP